MIALDTNVLIYLCDQSDPKRQRKAMELVSTAKDGVLLWQVACEFIGASRKLSDQGFTASDAWNRLAEFLDLLPLVLPTGSVLLRARELHLSHNISDWDATILAACREVGVDVLYSEDIPGLSDLGSLRVVNPFV